MGQALAVATLTQGPLCGVGISAALLLLGPQQSTQEDIDLTSGRRRSVRFEEGAHQFEFSAY
jgi:hypothetical protein